MTFDSKKGRVKRKISGDGGTSSRSPEDVIRGIKRDMKNTPGEDYRDRSLAIHGLICAYCGREFDHTTRHLLTVHHKDGNHHNNPPDGSNWENLCVYCHENVHSRELLGNYLDGAQKEAVGGVVSESKTAGEKSNSGFGVLARKLQEAMKKKERN